MKLLVTGGAGFIGSAVVRLAVARGHHVVNLDALTYAACLANVAPVTNSPLYEFEQADIRDRAALERNFREKFEALNRVNLSDAEFKRLLEDIVTPDVFTAARTLRERNAFTRDDGTPLTHGVASA